MFTVTADFSLIPPVLRELYGPRVTQTALYPGVARSGTLNTFLTLLARGPDRRETPARAPDGVVSSLAYRPRRVSPRSPSS